MQFLSLFRASGTAEVNKIVSKLPTFSYGQCACCGIAVKYVYGVSQYKCFACNTVVTIVEEEVAASDASIELNEILLVKQHCESNKTKMRPHEKFKPLAEYLNVNVVSINALNNSFRQNKADKLDLTLDLNYDEILQFYELLTNLPTTRPYLTFLSSCYSLLNNCTKPLKDIGDLRWLFIIFELPTLKSAHLFNPKRAPNNKFQSPEIKSLSYEICKKCVGYLSNIDSELRKKLVKLINRKEVGDGWFEDKINLLNICITFSLLFIVRNNDKLSTEEENIKYDTSPTFEEYLHSEKLNPDLASETVSKKQKREFIKNMFCTYFLSAAVAQSSSKQDKLTLRYYENDLYIKNCLKILSILFKSRYNFNCKRDSIFYNPMVDFIDTQKDFRQWENNYSSISNFKFCEYPFVLSLANKISVLENEVNYIKERESEEVFRRAINSNKLIDMYLRIRVRREFVTTDSLNFLKTHLNELKKSIKVEFLGEPGIDLGGLTKEWFGLVIKDLFNEDNGMFYYNPESLFCWFVPNSLEKRNSNLYFLIGVILGLAVYNSTTLNLSLPTVFFKKLLGKDMISMNDFKEVFPEQFRGLEKLINCNDGKEIELMELYFETVYRDQFGEIIQHELVQNGSNTRVSAANKLIFVKLWVNFYLNIQVEDQFKPLKDGFYRVVGGNNALTLFSEEELQALLCNGVKSAGSAKLNVQVLRCLTKYTGFKSREEAESSEIVYWFWKWLESTTQVNQRLLVKFVTGREVLHFSDDEILRKLNLKISRGSGTGRLPVAHVCFNQLVLYEYESELAFVASIETSIAQCYGFGLK